MVSEVAPKRSAGRQAQWRVETFPLKQAIAYLSLPEVRSVDAITLGGFLASDAYLETALPEVRRGVLMGVLKALVERNDSGGDTLISFARVLSLAFGLNVVGLHDAQEVLRAWSATGVQNLMIPERLVNSL